MIKKQFIVTIIVDENHNVVKERSVCQSCDSVDEYIYKQIRCFENKYEKGLSVKENLEMWGESIKAKELNIKEKK